jgi:hypothetical protein
MAGHLMGVPADPGRAALSWVRSPAGMSPSRGRGLTTEPTLLVSGGYTQLYRAALAGLQAILMPRPDEA